MRISEWHERMHDKYDSALCSAIDNRHSCPWLFGVGWLSRETGLSFRDMVSPRRVRVNWIIKSGSKPNRINQHRSYCRTIMAGSSQSDHVLYSMDIYLFPALVMYSHIVIVLLHSQAGYITVSELFRVPTLNSLPWLTSLFIKGICYNWYRTIWFVVQIPVKVGRRSCFTPVSGDDMNLMGC